MSPEPDLRQAVLVEGPAAHVHVHELARLPLSDGVSNSCLADVSISFPCLGPGSL